MSLLGIDIGGTKLALGLADDAGRIHRGHRQPMSLSGDPSRDLEALGAALEDFLAVDDFVVRRKASLGSNWEPHPDCSREGAVREALQRRLRD